MPRKKKKLDVFYYHEALDRSYVVADIIDRTLLEHPVIKSHPALENKIVKAQELIVEVYQEIGGLEVTLFPEPTNSNHL